MVDFFDRIYTSISNKNILMEKIRINSLIRFVIRLTANIITPLYFSLTRNNKQHRLQVTAKREGRIIVSLTTFPPRIRRIWLVIESVMRQTQKPDRIVLWLSREQFPFNNLIPKKLIKQKERGLEIRWVNGDIRSHKKYYYALQEFPKDYLLTLDDDFLYRSKMVEDLSNYSNRYPKTVISQYSKKIQWTENQLESYSTWPTITEASFPNLSSFFGSGGGTLFPPFCLDSDVLNIKLFTSLTPTADDVWLNAMCRLKGTKIVKTSYYTERLPVIYLSCVSLASINNGMNQNNVQILAVRDYYLKTRGIDPFSH